MLVSALLLSVKDVLQDDTGDRYTDASLVRALNLGIYELRHKRPDFFIGQYADPTAQVVETTEELPVPEVCIPALVAYTAGWAEMRDDEYTADGRAASLLGKLRADMGGA